MRTTSFAQRCQEVWKRRFGVPNQGGAAIRVLSFLAVSLLLSGCRSAGTGRAGPAAECPPKTPPESWTQAQATPASEPEAGFPLEPGEEISLFDGETLGQWKVTDFGGQGDVHVKEGAIHLEMGSYATGITWSGPLVRMNYEITLEAMRVQGSDFFCGLTFPVGEKPWGGSVCGLSNIDYYDAAENETTRIIGFENGRWYRVRLRVVPTRIQAWLDGEELVDVDTTGRNIDIRVEMDLCQPLGIATWVTAGAIRDIKLKKLSEQTE
jgi:hypothetical protein